MDAYVFDFDGTLATQRGGWRLLSELYGTRDRMDALGEQYRADELTFREWCEGLVTAWRAAGVERPDIERAARAVKLTNGAERLLERLVDREAQVGIISGGVTALQTRVEWVAPVFAVANDLVYEDGIPVGVRARVGPDDKGDVLRRCAADHGIDPQDIVYVGDSHTDAEAFEVAGRAVLFNPDDRVGADVIDGVDAVIEGPTFDGVAAAIGL